MVRALFRVNCNHKMTLGGNQNKIRMGHNEAVTACHVDLVRLKGNPMIEFTNRLD